MNESDRLIAERMGWIACSGDHWGDKIHWKRTLGCAPFDLADARDREVVIAWLNAQGMTVRLDHGPDGHTVIIWAPNDLGTKGAYPVSTIEEAFRAAVLAATEGKEQ